MEQFTVPQFIENEDKILGPVTVRQFVIMLVAVGLLFVIYRITDLVLFIIWVVIIGGSAAVLAFLKINGQPFHVFLLHVVGTVKDPSLRVWRKEVTSADIVSERAQYEEHRKLEEKERESPIPTKAPLSEQKLAELSLLVDTGGAYSGEDKE